MYRRLASWVVALLLVAGCGRLKYDETDGSSQGQSDWIFVVEDQAGFDLGDYGGGTAQLVWSGEQVEFEASPPFDKDKLGIYVSPLFDTGDASAIWDTLAFVPSAPASRPLPDLGTSDSGYAEGGVSMAENILLLHLDDTALAEDSLIVDSSGQRHDGQIVLNGQGVAQTEGEFNGALDLDRDAWVRLEGTYFDFGTSDFTYAVWVKMRPCSESNNNRIALGGGGANDRPHMWLGSSCPGVCPGGDGVHMNFLDDSRNGPSLSNCSGVPLEDGNWHHIAAVKKGHTAPAALLHLYADGREVDADSYDFGANTFSYAGGEIRLGGFNLGTTTYNTSIVVDEAAIWKRALTDVEITTLFRRGAVDLKLQIRVCADTCGSEAFVGPDGTSTSYFTEADLVGAPGAQNDNLASLALVGAKAQFRATFSTAASDVSPGLRRVVLEARRP